MISTSSLAYDDILQYNSYTNQWVNNQKLYGIEYAMGINVTSAGINPLNTTITTGYTDGTVVE